MADSVEAQIRQFITSSYCPYECAANETSIVQILSHSKLMCYKCCERGRTTKFPDTSDFIYGEEEQSSFEGSDAVEVQQNERRHQERSEQKRRKMEKDKMIMENNTPFRMALHTLKKSGLSEMDALLSILDKKRENAGKSHRDTEREADIQVPRNLMPWAPRHIHPSLKGKHSILTRHIDHQRYVAIASNLLAPDPRYRFEHNKKDLKIIDGKLSEERRTYKAIAMEVISENRYPIYSCNKNIIQFVKDRLKVRRIAIAGKYGHPINVISSANSSSMNGTSSSVSALKILNRGNLPTVIYPNGRRKFMFPNDLTEIAARFPTINENPLESDEMAIKWAMKDAVGVVMSCSSAIALLSRPYLSESSNMLLPVTIVERLHECGYRANICIVGKPCPEGDINHPTVLRRFLKYSVKSALYPMQKSSVRSYLRRQPKRSVGESPEYSATSVRQRVPCKESEEDNLKIAENNENEQHSQSSSAEIGDVLSVIMNEMNAVSKASTSDNKDSAEELVENLEGFDARKSYVKFSFGDGIQTIIRSNNDGIDSNGNILAIAQKAEYAAEFGAEELFEEEWIRDYFKCILKGGTQLVRFRIQNKGMNFLQREICSEKNLLAGRRERLLLVDERINAFKTLVSYLRTLKKGSYLIRTTHTDEVQILPKIDTQEKPHLEIHDGQITCTHTLPAKAEELFRGIDEHYVFIYHMVQKRIPCTFPLFKGSSDNRLRKPETMVKAVGENKRPNGPSRKRNRAKRRRNIRHASLHEDQDQAEK